MKFFDRNGKYNWVDENNVLLGYCSNQSCCENFGYYYLDSLGKKLGDYEIGNENDFLKDYVFDPDHCVESGDGSSGCLATFKLVIPGGFSDTDRYLTIYNYHNGYYSHGFSMDKGGITLHRGSL